MQLLVWTASYRAAFLFASHFGNGVADISSFATISACYEALARDCSCLTETSVHPNCVARCNGMSQMFVHNVYDDTHARSYQQETCTVRRDECSSGLEEKGYILNTGCQYEYDTVTKCTLALTYSSNRMIIAVIR